MTIVHVAAYFAPAYGFGGPPRSLLALCRAQRDAGLDVEVFTTTANPDGELEPRPDGEEVEGVRVRRFALGWPRRWLGAPGMARPLTDRLRAADVAHLHGLFNRTIWTAGQVARRVRTPYLVSPRGMLERSALAHHAWRKRAAHALFDEAVLRRAAAWHATSSSEAATLAARAGARRIVEIPNSVEPLTASDEDRRTARTLAGLTGGEPFALFLGRVHPIKRLDLLAAAFTTLVERGRDMHLVIAGPDEAGHRAVVASHFAPLGARVRWAGPVDGGAKAGLLAEARALVLCSDSESFGMSVAEALAAGTPAVVTRSCPWPLLVAEGAGFWVPQQPGAIADALDLLMDASLAASMGARGQTLVARRFSATAVARRWIECYQAIGREQAVPA